MIFKATMTEGAALEHHGIKGQKWGVLNPETKFKYGLTDLSPAAVAAAGGTVDPEYKKLITEKFRNGDVSLADYRRLTMSSLMDSAKSAPVSSERKAELQQKLLKGEISAAEYRRLTSPGGDAETESGGSSSQTQTREKRSYLQEALAAARQKKGEEEEQKEEKTSKSSGGSSKGSGGKGSGGGKGGKGGGGGKGSSAKEEKEEEEKWVEESIDRGKTRYVKSAYWNQLNAKRAKRRRHQRSLSGRTNTAKVQRTAKSLKHAYIERYGL